MKNLILLITFISFPVLLSAQNFKGGIIAGLSMNQVDGDTYSGYHKPGFIIGGVVNKPFNDLFTLAMELKFIQKGARTSYNIDTDNGEFYRIKLNYIQLPLLAQFNVWDGLWLEAGLGVGVLVSGKEENAYGEMDDIDFKKMEFLGALGVAYDIPSTRLRFGVRATNSIIPIRINENFNNLNSYWKRKGQYNRNLEFMFTLFL